MRNLIHLTSYPGRIPISIHQNQEDDPDTALLHGFDISHVPDGGFITLTNRGRLTYAVKDDIENASVVQKPRWTLDIMQNIESNDNDDSFFFCSFADEVEAVFCLSRRGKVVRVDLPMDSFDEKSAPNTVELVGEFEYGINCASWSPDFEVLLLHVNTEDVHAAALLAMNNRMDVMAEISLEKFVDVDGVSGDLSVDSVSLTWKGDASKVAVSSVDEDGIRRIKIFDKDSLTLKSIGRMENGSDVKNLNDTIAWCPNGSIIASVQSSKRSSQIIFFESCGLRHREFKLNHFDARHERVKQLSWNGESDLLAILIDTKSGQSDICRSRVQLWYRENYHWYMKWESNFSGRKVEKVAFNTDQPYELLMSFSLNLSLNEVVEWLSYDFCWDMCLSHDSTTSAAVIDGNLLQLTPLTKAVVPPPMSATSLTFDHPVCHVSFSPFFSSDISAIVELSNGDFIFLGTNGRDVSTPSIVPSYKPPHIICRCRKSSLAMSHFIFDLRQTSIAHMSDDGNSVVIVGLVYDNVKEVETLVEILMQMPNEKGNDGEWAISQNITLERRALRLIYSSDVKSKMIIELDNGSLLEYNYLEGLQPLDTEPLLEACPWIAFLNVSSQVETRPVVIGLSRRSRLYFGDHLVSSSVSSFILTKQFLCYVLLGSRSQLRFIAVKFLIEWDPFAGSDDQQNIAVIEEGYEPRNVERGTKLVAIPSSLDAKCIIQMPRGNLEAITPRALALPYCRSLLDNSCYAEAFDLIRRQRIDMNLITDHNPQKFMAEVDLFLKQVCRDDYLNLFIASLQNYDVTSSKYIVPVFGSSRMEEKVECAVFDFSSKVNQICRHLRNQMMDSSFHSRVPSTASLQDNKFLHPILSTFAKETPPKLEEALRLIQDIAISLNVSLLSEGIQSSLQYLAFLANYDLLYETALGMYDFELCKAVARNSQKDPKVYLPMLAKLNSKPKLLAMLDVDLQLGRNESALKHLFDAKDLFGEDHFLKCLEMIEKYKLHHVGLTLFPKGSISHTTILKSLGERLLCDENKPKVALGIFLSLEPKFIDGVKRAARACGDWRTYFSYCMKENSKEDTSEIAFQIAEEIAEGRRGDYSKRETVMFSVQILLDYCDDIDSAIDSLSTAAMFGEARRIALLKSREDLENGITRAAQTYARSCLKDFNERAETFEESSDRYAVVIKMQKEQKSITTMNDEVNDEQSLFSVGSNVSNASLYSNISASSVGSVTSLSSVISVKAESTFSIVGVDAEKHRSKFNRLGQVKKKKKKRKTRKQLNKLKRGTEEELNELVFTLKVQILSNDSFQALLETIRYLAQVGKVTLANELVEAYRELTTRISSCQAKRKERETEERQTDGGVSSDVILVCEKDVDALECQSLPIDIEELFEYLDF